MMILSTIGATHFTLMPSVSWLNVLRLQAHSQDGVLAYKVGRSFSTMPANE